MMHENLSQRMIYTSRAQLIILPFTMYIYVKFFLPEYSWVVLVVLGHVFFPQRVYTAPPVIPPDFPAGPRGPLDPLEPRLPGGPVKIK